MDVINLNLNQFLAIFPQISHQTPERLERTRGFQKLLPSQQEAGHRFLGFILTNKQTNNQNRTLKIYLFMLHFVLNSFLCIHGDCFVIGDLVKMIDRNKTNGII